MSSRTEHSTSRDGTGSSGVPGAAPAQPGAGIDERFDRHLDGLFTYCLSVLCAHEAAVGVVRDVLELAARKQSRAPQDETDRQAWLYALARWVCLRRLTETRGRSEEGAREESAEGRERRRELARLAWPEAAGTSPEQREALELAVRHELTPPQVASVIGLEASAARELLAAAACEVERTRVALGVAASGGCPVAARYAGDRRIPLGSALRGELVRHVDECPRCRRTAERAGAAEPWPGTAVTPDALPVLTAPRAEILAGPTAVPSKRRKGAAQLRLDRKGFPLDARERAARRERLRSRAVTSTVVATVVAAPLLALWTSYGGGLPFLDDGPDGGRAVSARDSEGKDGAGAEPYENAGSAQEAGAPLSATVVDPGGRHRAGASGLAITVRTRGDTSLITLRATGRAPLDWGLATGADWVRLSKHAGRLERGESVTVLAHVVRGRAPGHGWRAEIRVSPVDAVIVLSGGGTRTRAHDKGAGDGGQSAEPPTASRSAGPSHSQEPPTDTGPSEDPPPTGPGPSEPPTSQPPEPPESTPPTSGPTGPEEPTAGEPGAEGEQQRRH
ncbi:MULTISPECIES: sigma-70 family RNA polymerase sigma factor [Streptomyces]|uniref:Sigma-70 family RNA polymerase sigma factor n=2 Tax=Streptomyces TaxID=1883 RepID=A0ABU2R9A3_9ACTN|nr:MULTISPECIES: sigma-70 family RNA polymerase sigma factor [unclassified Streptomyces]MDT0411914.1 sigma-70 family RNA polymerase sigma factor [Streptomyces sp. DSM 41979]MYQ59208.1 sigma-70 family RNA polymerase sigma factor [Streptomyces sp. SID4926]